MTLLVAPCAEHPAAASRRDGCCGKRALSCHPALPPTHGAQHCLCLGLLTCRMGKMVVLPLLLHRHGMGAKGKYL